MMPPQHAMSYPYIPPLSAAQMQYELGAMQQQQQQPASRYSSISSVPESSDEPAALTDGTGPVASSSSSSAAVAAAAAAAAGAAELASPSQQQMVRVPMQLPAQPPNAGLPPPGPPSSMKMLKSRLLPRKAHEKLHVWFNEHLSNPYPSKDEMMMLVGQAGLTETQVRQLSCWIVSFSQSARRSATGLPMHAAATRT